jgi:hypothetical protein
MLATRSRQQRTDVQQLYSQVIRKKIPIRIKNVENPRGLGTVIHPNSDLDASETGEMFLREPVSVDKLGYFQMADQGHKKLPTAVTIKERIIILNVNSNRKSVSHGFLAGIFGTLDRYGVAVDLISTSEVHISMAIEETHEKKVIDRLVRDLETYGTVSPRSPFPCPSRLKATSVWDYLGTGDFAARDGDSLARGKAEKYGGNSWAHVHITRAGRGEYRDDKPGCERSEHLMRDPGSGCCESLEFDPPELSTDQGRGEAWAR